MAVEAPEGWTEFHAVLAAKIGKSFEEFVLGGGEIICHRPGHGMKPRFCEWRKARKGFRLARIEQPQRILLNPCRPAEILVTVECGMLRSELFCEPLRANVWREVLRGSLKGEEFRHQVLVLADARHGRSRMEGKRGSQREKRPSRPVPFVR
jgi:hypothetical protein